MAPADDAWPPVAAAGWSDPVPLGRPVNTAGAEDSPFVSPDGQALYFVFTPDVRVPPERQLLDGATGIWRAQRHGAGWAEPERVLMVESGELALDGCPVVTGEQLLFCSVRAGNERELDLFGAHLQGSEWQRWAQDYALAHEMGEFFVSADGSTLVFTSARPGSQGGRDLWLAERAGDGWSEPANLGPAVNTAGEENRPFLTADGQELWFDRPSGQGLPGPAVWRAVRQADGAWGQAEEVVSSFAGEPTLSPDGRTLYFVHHFYGADLDHMIEADIYVATRDTD